MDDENVHLVWEMGKAKWNVSFVLIFLLDNLPSLIANNISKNEIFTVYFILYSMIFGNRISEKK